jgi:hypothetical protein
MEELLSLAEVGRDYERFIGYKYETAGWNVVYRGIRRGVADRGIDLVCWSGSKVHIVQCKRWTITTPINSTVVQDLIRTTREYTVKKHFEDQLGFEWPEAASKKVRAVLFTTSVLQTDAKKLASANKVSFKQRYRIEDYPKIKCYRTSTGKKVYLTPACYSYDSVSMKCMLGDCYVHSEAEAMKRGFEKHEERMALFAAPKRSSSSDDGFQTEKKPSVLARLKAWLFGFRLGL